MRSIILFLTLVSLGLGGCKDQPQTTPSGDRAGSPVQSAEAPPSPHLLLNAPADPTVVELPSQALPVWRQFRSSQPVLVLLSQDPLLARIPGALHNEALSLVRSGSKEEFAAGTDIMSANPLLMPSMALSAALESGCFSRIVWVLPPTETIEELSVETFRKQLQELGAIDEEEAASFSAVAAGSFAGTVRGVRFEAAHPDALPDISEPVVLHIDLSFFQPLYKGEVKTPLYPLLAQTLTPLRQEQWQCLAATISLSNLDGRIPLASRFAGKDISAFFRDPTIFDQSLPEYWDLRTRALYLENFFKKEEVRELYLKMAQKEPGDSSAKYALYAIARQFKEVDQAMGYLQGAVKLDRAYALEYLNLADLAREKGLYDQVTRMLDLAHNAFPDNPFVTLTLAEHLFATGQPQAAEPLLKKLQGLKWSEVYYPKIPGHLEKLKQTLTAE